MTTGLTWNLIDDIRQLLSFHFMLNALRAGTIVAIVAGAIGYLMVLRRQSFAGHTLALIGFPGAAGATWLGLDAAFGYFGFCVAGALIISALPGGGRRNAGLGGFSEESAGIGTVQAFALACGFLFVSLYRGFLNGLNSLLFGTIIGITDQQVLVLLIAGIGCLLALVVLGRPLLFSTIDPDVAQARGVPTRLVSTAFLVLLGIAAGGTSQITGSLLVFALLVAPAAAATRLTPQPAAGVALSITLAVLITWTGEAFAFFSPYPIGFWVTTLGFAVFLLATAYRAIADRIARRPPIISPQQRVLSESTTR
ncbi:MAG TPA: metal ABC transporter permease [Pseudonocardiaceae bacterium]|jgi:zinc/manganese transport system permease protein|nr:metal ABC transporter permease [Pseudonocardiaceae bacterium]